MASEVTRFSHDGNWKVEIEAWRNNWFFYSSIGTQVTVYRKSGSSIWGGTSWSEAPARSIVIRNLYNGGLAFQDGQWNDASHAELKHWAFGIEIKIPSGFPGGSDLVVTSVEGIVSVFLPNGEGFEARVDASSIIEDSSIW